ncbi:MAG: hypothetical protein LGB68_01775 [Sulfurovum sp.]|nr:hypothetical protein [Sulfurovum sp.]MCB4745873.1 hypothetical protein [Sulfurovum sp.]
MHTIYRYLCHFSLTAWLLLGCTHPIEPKLEKRISVHLTHMLTRLSPEAPYLENVRLAEDIVHYSHTLEIKFDRHTYPWLHNFLVNVGLKERGLCYHYSDALYQYLKQQYYPHFTFHQAGANIGEYFYEHNVLVILSSKWSHFEEGIVIDVWREPGNIFISNIKDDAIYQWKHRPYREYGYQDHNGR